MARRKSVRLPNYPGILLELGYGYTGEVKGGRLRQCFEALALHYKLTPPVGGFFDPAPDGSKSMEERWMNLAIYLMRDFVPAFRVPARGGAPARVQRRKSSIYPYAHEARLVQIVLALQRMLKAKNRSATRTAAFAQLVKQLKNQPAYSWAYGELQKPTSFAQAWKKIPDKVKTTPESFLPEPTNEREFYTLKGGLFGVGNWLVANDAERVWLALPAIPDKLPQ